MSERQMDRRIRFGLALGVGLRLLHVVNQDSRPKLAPQPLSTSGPFVERIARKSSLIRHPAVFPRRENERDGFKGVSHPFSMLVSRERESFPAVP